MPLFEYKCQDCEESFEELVSSGADTVTCPKCGSTRVERQISAFSAGSASFGGHASSSASCGSGKFT